MNLGPSASQNNQEIACYAALIKTNVNITAGIIGGEVLLFNLLTEPELISYINQAKLVGDRPVTTGESWGIWCNWSQISHRCQGRPALGNAVDFILAHTHPYWEMVPIEHGAAHVVATYITLRVIYPERDVIIGETGWPTCGDSFGNAMPGLQNQRRFIKELWRWSKLYGVHILYFEAFDEDWKASVEGEVGRCWGVYYSNRTPKHNDLDWSSPTLEATPTTTAFHIDHPHGNSTTTTKPNCAIPIFGRVHNAQPGWRVKVEVFTDAWYLQDKWYPDGLAPIIDGMWSMPEIFLANQNAPFIHAIRVTLVDGTGNSIATEEINNISRANACSS